MPPRLRLARVVLSLGTGLVMAFTTSAMGITPGSAIAPGGGTGRVEIGEPGASVRARTAQALSSTGRSSESGYAKAKRQWIAGVDHSYDRASYFDQAGSALYAVLSAGGGNLATYPPALEDLFTLASLPEVGATPVQIHEAKTDVATLNAFFGTSVLTDAVTRPGFPLRPGTSAPAFLVHLVSFVSDQVGFGLLQGASPRQLDDGVSVSQLAETTDGGLHWVALDRLPLSGDDPEPGAITVDGLAFATARLGYIWDQGEIFVTHDGGTHWRRLPSPVPGGRSYLVEDIALTGGLLWVAYTPRPSCGWGGKGCTQGISVWDGGWRRTFGPLAGENISLLTAHGSTVYAFAERVERDGPTTKELGGHLLTTSTGGGPWESYPGPPCASEAYGSEPTALAVSDGRMLIECGTQTGDLSYWLSTAGAATWSFRSEEEASGGPASLVAGGGRFWKVVDFANSSPAVSTDDGTTWTTVNGIDSEGAGINQVQFVDALHGWCVSEVGLWRTSDGGVTWRRVGPLAPQTP